MPLCRNIGDGLWEVRSDLGNRIARVIFCIAGGCMVLLHGFIKKSQKTPAIDRDLAQAHEGHKMKKVKKGRIGASFDDFLKEEGIYEEVTARAIKRVIARQLDTLMQSQGLTKTELAKRMQTSRAQLDRLLDPDNESVTLGTLTRAAHAVGRSLRLELI
jgi:DNA-binding Xre family transcriptional regulator